jgi:hypothetical protein
MDIASCSILGGRNFFVSQPNSAIKKIQHSDDDKEIRCHQPSSLAAASCCTVNQMLPSTFVVVAVVVAVAWQWQGG